MTKDQLTAKLAAFLECGEDDIGESEPFFAVDEFLTNADIPEADSFYDTENMVIWLCGEDGTLQVPFCFGSEGETRLIGGPSDFSAAASLGLVRETLRQLESRAGEARAFAERLATGETP